MIPWDDLRLVLAISRARGLAGAASSLALNQSTVFRRLNALEEKAGVRLFERVAGGYQPTPAGAAMLGAAERMEEEALALERSIAGRDAALEGTIRVTSSETLAFRLLTQEIARLREVHPGIRVELVIDNRLLSLGRREADIALRATRPVQGGLFGRKLADVAWSAYAAKAYAEEHGLPAEPADLPSHRIIGWDDPSVPVRAGEWLAELVPDAAVVYRSNSLINQLVAAKAGIGIALLPCYLGDPEPALVRAFPPVPELSRELWLITHADLKGTARIRAFFEVVGVGLARRRALLAGVAEGSAPPLSESRRRRRARASDPPP